MKRTFATSLLILALILTSFTAAHAQPREVEGLAFSLSKRSPTTVLQKLTNTLNANKKIFVIAAMPFDKAAKGVGVDLRFTRTIMFGNPKMGTPLIKESRTVAIDLPQKILVYKDKDGKTYAVYNTVEYLKARHGLKNAKTLPKIKHALLKLTTAATAGHVIYNPSTKVHKHDGLVIVKSKYSFDKTFFTLKKAIMKKKLKLFGEIDHARNARLYGMHLPPTRLLIFGAPKIGMPLAVLDQTLALDEFPQKALIWEEEDGTAYVAYNDPVWQANRRNVHSGDRGWKKISTMLKKLTAKATGNM